MRMRGLAATFLVALAAGAPSAVPNGAAEFESGADLVVPRMAAGIATLPDGSVLLVGGRGPGFESLTTAEIRDPATGTWTATEVGAGQLDACTLVRLSDGRLLIAGGAYNGGGTPGWAQAALFDPSDRTFSATGSLNIPRFWAAGAELADGKVFVFGGWYGGGHLGSSSVGEVWDPDTGAFSTVLPASLERAGAVVVPLDDGTAYILSGFQPYGGNLIETVEKYDPATGTVGIVRGSLFETGGTWQMFSGVSLQRPVADQRMPDGRYLFSAFAVEDGSWSHRLVTVDPATQAIEPFPTMTELPPYGSVWMDQHPVVDPLRGVAYLVGQTADTSAECRVWSVDLTTGAVSGPSSALTVGATYFPNESAVTLLSDGTLLFAGGHSDSSNSSAFRATFLHHPQGRPPVDPPASPDGVALSVAGPRSVGVTWTDRSGDESRFEIECSTDGGATWALAGTASRDATSFIDEVDGAGLLCRYRVRARNAAGASMPSPEAEIRSAGGTAAASARRLDFGTLRARRDRPDVERTRTFVVRNTHRRAPLWVGVGKPSPQIRNATPETAPDPFEVVSGYGDHVVAPRGKVRVAVRYRPSAPGASTWVLPVTLSDPRRDAMRVRLSGRAKFPDPE